jgi:hypothetical protein
VADGPGVDLVAEPQHAGWVVVEGDGDGGGGLADGVGE